MTITTEQWLNELNNTFTQAHDLMVRKNKDYSGDEPLSCFETPFTSACTGILVRMWDKVNRLQNIYINDAQVKDEAFDDTLIDLMNYACILLTYRRLHPPQSFSLGRGVYGERTHNEVPAHMSKDTYEAYLSQQEPMNTHDKWRTTL